MYIVEIQNGTKTTEIHGLKKKITSGSIVKGINTIDSFSFSMSPSNPGFSEIVEFSTLVTAYNTRKNKYDFVGRVLYAETTMDSDGSINKSVICESVLGYLCDSWQTYVDVKNWTVKGIFQHLIDCHNSLVEDYKKFKVGTITVTDNNDNLYQAIQRENTWNAIKSKLIDTLGGELLVRFVDGEMYLDYLQEIGEVKDTEIALSVNMKSITQEKNPTDFVTRLIPLGAKLTDGEKETEHRLDISSVNNGVTYIDDVEAIAAYGIHVGCVEYDDVTDAGNLKRKGEQWIAENNRVHIKYSITALDLSLVGNDFDDFEICNYYPIVNPLLGINDVARITKQTIDVCDETKSTIEVGDKFKTLSDMQAEQSSTMTKIANSVVKIEKNYVTSEAITAESQNISSAINQSADRILLSVADNFVSKTTVDEYSRLTESQLELLKNQLFLSFTEAERRINGVDADLQEKFNKITKYFTFDVDGLTIGQVDNPNKVVIDNDEITILVHGFPVQKFDANGNALIPTLKVTKSMNCLGLVVEEDETHINCEYVEG